MENKGVQTMNKAVGYLRCSTDKQDQSIPDQRKAIQEYAEKNGLIISEWFADEGRSGTGTEKRDEFNRMIKLIEKGENDFNYILVYDISRWGRFPDDDEAAYWEFHCKRHKVNLIYTHEELMTENKLANSLIKNLKRNSAGEFSRNLSKLTTRGSKTAARQGFWNGGQAPYGYKRVECDDNGDLIGELKPYQKVRASLKVKLAPGDPTEIEVVQKIFDLYVNRGYGLRRIANALNSEKIASPNKGKQISVKNHRGEWVKKQNKGQWNLSTIHFMLMDEVYIVSIVYGKNKKGKFSADENTWQDKDGKKTQHDKNNWVVAKNAHKAIVDKELFKKAQETRKVRKHFCKASDGNPYGSKYLVTGLMFCERCGFKFVGHSNVSGEKKYLYYQDGGFLYKGLEICNGKRIRREMIDDFALERVKHRLNSKLWRKQLKKRLNQRFSSVQPNIINSGNIEDEIVKVEIEINNLLDVIAISGLTHQLRSKLTERQSKLEHLKSMKKTHNPTRNDRDYIEDEIQKYLNKLSNVDELFKEATNDEKKKLLKYFIDRITVNEERDKITFCFYKTPLFGEGICAHYSDRSTCRSV
jgi:DNA invertase Pin-like site-specific DNA recombinase